MKAKWVNIVDSLQGNVNHTADSGKLGMGCCVCEAGVEQEDKESKGRAPDEHPMSIRSASDGD